MNVVLNLLKFKYNASMVEFQAVSYSENYLLTFMRVNMQIKA